MAVFFTFLHGVGACGGLLERGLAGFGRLGRQSLRYRQVLPRLQFPNTSGCDTGRHRE
jgi:hypothetical protein